MRGWLTVTIGSTIFLLLLGGGAFGAVGEPNFVSSVQLSENYVPTLEKPFSLPQTEAFKVVADYRGLTEKEATKPGAVDISAVGFEVTTKLAEGLALTTTYVRSRSGLGARFSSEPEVLGLTLASSFAVTPTRAGRGVTRRYFTRSSAPPEAMDKFAGAFRRYKLERSAERLKASVSYTQVGERFTAPTEKLAQTLQQGGLLAPVMTMRGMRHLDVSLGGELIKGLKLTASYERLKTKDQKGTALRQVSLAYGKEFEFALGEVRVEKGLEIAAPLDKALATRVAGRSALGLGWMDRKGLESVKAISGLEERFRSLRLSPSFGLTLTHKSRLLSLGGREREVALAFEELGYRDVLKLTREYRWVGGALQDVKTLGLADWEFLNLLKGREREVTSLALKPREGLSLTHKAHRLRWAGGDVVVSVGELMLSRALKVTREYKRVSAGAPAPEQLAQMLGFSKEKGRVYAGLAGKEREVVIAELRPSRALGLTRSIEVERELADKLQGGRKESTTIQWTASPKLTMTYLVESQRGLNPEVHPFAKRILGRLRFAPSKGWAVTVEAGEAATEMRVRGRVPQRQGETARRAVKVEKVLEQGKISALLEREKTKGARGEEVETDIRDISLQTRVFGGLSLTTRYREASPDRGPSHVLREVALQGPVRALKGGSFVAQFVESEQGKRKEQGLLKVAFSNLKLSEGLSLTTEFKREERGTSGVTMRVAQAVGQPFKGLGIKPLEGLTLTATYRSQKPLSGGQGAVGREVKAILPLVGGRGGSKLTALLISEERGGRTTVHREFYLDALRLMLKPKEELGLDLRLAFGLAERESEGTELPMSLVRFGGKLLSLKLTGQYAVGREGAQRIVMKEWRLEGGIFGGLKLTADYRWNQPKGEKRLSVAQVPLQWQPGGVFTLSLAQDKQGKPKWGAAYDRRLDVQGRVTQEQYRVSYERETSGWFRSDLVVTKQYAGVKARRYELGFSYGRVVSPQRHELSLAAKFMRYDFKAPSAKDKTDYEVTLTYRLPASW